MKSTVKSVFAALAASATLCLAGIGGLPTASAAVLGSQVTAQATAVVSSVGRNWTGTYQTPKGSGTISFTAVRAIQYGYIGYVAVDGVRHLGVEYWSAQAPGQRFFNWAYANGTTAVAGATSAVDATTESGTISFYSSRGALLRAGTVTIH